MQEHIEGRGKTDMQILADLEKMKLLTQIHANIWDSAILEDVFKFERRLLTPTEHQILEFKIEGKDNQEIAELIGCKLHTIRCRVRDIRFKLRTGVKERPSKTWAFKGYNKFKRSFRGKR